MLKIVIEYDEKKVEVDCYEDQDYEGNTCLMVEDVWSESKENITDSYSSFELDQIVEVVEETLLRNHISDIRKEGW